MNRGDGNRGQLTRRPGTSLGRSSGYGWGDPWQEMAEMRRRMDDLFGRFFGSSLQMPSLNDWAPAVESGMEPDVDVYDNETEYVVHAAMPGCRAEDMNLQATDDTVMLSCEYRSPFESQPQQASGEGQKQGGPTAMRQSRFSRAGRFEFSYTFPEEIDPNQVSADFKNGRLELKVPKVQAPGRSTPIKIPIQGGAASPSIAGSSQAGTGPGAQGNVAEPFVPAVGGQAAKRAAHETRPEEPKGRGSRGKAANPSPS